MIDYQIWGCSNSVKVYRRMSSLLMISVTREWILFMRATHSIWLVAFRVSVMPSAVAPDADVGKFRGFDEGDVVVAYELVVQVGFGIVDDFLH